MPYETQPRRGCIFFNFGSVYALRLLVALHSLRKHYSGPVTVYLWPDEASDALAADLEALGAHVVLSDRLSKSFDRHRLFQESPYETTLVLDSDLIFRGPIDELWDDLEREGLLVTCFHANDKAGSGHWPSRTGWLADVRGLLDADTYERALRRLMDEKIDINIGLMGISRPRGDAFLADWANRMEIARTEMQAGRMKTAILLDEILVVALVCRHPHVLADEKWNCPADEGFRRTRVPDARVIHYFAEGGRCNGRVMGRNPVTPAGKLWYRSYNEAARHLDLQRWCDADPMFVGRLGRWHARWRSSRIGGSLKAAERQFRRVRNRVRGR